MTGAESIRAAGRRIAPRTDAPRRDPRVTAGFSLIELMIAVLILGILATIAYPNYTAYVDAGRRTDGQSALLDAAQRLERCYSSEMSYSTGNCGTLVSNLNGATSEQGFYTLSVTAGTTSYTLKAAPQGVHADDRCGTLELDQTGSQGVTGADSGIDADDCW